MQMTIPYFKYNSPEKACKHIIKESKKMWSQEELMRDDITVIVIYMKNN